MNRKPASPILALSAYPLSREYRAHLETAVGGGAEYLTLTELRQLSLLGMLGSLVGRRAERVLLPVEDRGQDAILPLLTTLAALTRARRIEVVEPDLSLSPTSRLRAVAALLRSAGASIHGLTIAAACRLELAWLGAARRRAATGGDGAILYLKTNLGLGVKAGGSVGHIAGVVNGFVRAGLPVIFLSAEEPLMVSPEVVVLEIPLPRALGLPRDVNQYLFHRRSSRRARRVPEAGSARFIYQRLSLGNYAGVTLSRRLGIPLVIEYNGSEVWVSKHWGYPLTFPRLAARAEDACLRHAHLLVTVSDVLRDELVGRGIEPARIVTYPNCIDPEIFDPARFTTEDLARLRDAYGIPLDAVVATFVGSFGRWHGAEVFARAIARLAERHEDWLEEHRVRFLLVGDGLMRPEVDAILSGVGPARWVVMPGLVPQAEAPLYLAASDILVSPHVPNPDGTPFFGSPTKLFEYMAMGKAIVASDLDQIGQVLAGSARATSLTRQSALPDDGSAVLTEPGSASQLELGLRLLVERPEWRSVLGQRARELALARYTWDRHVGAILDAFEHRDAADGRGS